MISSLPGIGVVYVRGSSTFALKHLDGSWRILVARDVPHSRQRFALAHEFKHVLDDAVSDRLYLHLPGPQQVVHREAQADWFASSLLMPRVWVHRDRAYGVAGLADRYGVPSDIMAMRIDSLDEGKPRR